MDFQLGQFIYRDEKYKTNEKRQPGKLFNLSHTGKSPSLSCRLWLQSVDRWSILESPKSAIIAAVGGSRPTNAVCGPGGR